MTWREHWRNIWSIVTRTHPVYNPVPPTVMRPERIHIMVTINGRLAGETTIDPVPECNAELTIDVPIEFWPQELDQPILYHGPPDG